MPEPCFHEVAPKPPGTSPSAASELHGPGPCLIGTIPSHKCPRYESGGISLTQAPCTLAVAHASSLDTDRTRNARAPTSTRRIVFCAMWVCISSSLSSSLASGHCYGPTTPGRPAKPLGRPWPLPLHKYFFLKPGAARTPTRPEGPRGRRPAKPYGPCRHGDCHYGGRPRTRRTTAEWEGGQ